MTRKAATSSPTPQGGTDLYETRHGLFAGGVRTLWDEGEAPAPTPAPAPAPAPADPLRLTDAEWRAKRKGELADAQVDKLVQKVIDLEATNQKLRQRETPEGGKALTPDEAREWEAYRALGKPDELKTSKEKGEAAQTELANVNRAKEVETLAGVAKAKSSVLTERLALSNLTAKLQGDAPASGQEDKRTVRLFDKDGKDVGELKEYATQNWPDYVPALFPQAAQTQPQGGTVVTAQAGAGTGTTAGGLMSYADRILAERQAAANPTSGGTA